MPGVIVSSQVSQYQVNVSVPSDGICQVSSDSMLIVKCQISGIRYQVLSKNMSSTVVRYQVSGIVSSITYQCQIINMSISG